MLRQFAVGFAVSILNIGIHALVTMLVVRATRRAGGNKISSQSLHLVAVMVTTASILMVAHTTEVAVWSSIYLIAAAAPPDANLMYFAFVNYTTLGYGDVTHVARWQLLGPMTAMNGMLLFGWSTAVIFEVLHRAMVRLSLVESI